MAHSESITRPKRQREELRTQALQQVAVTELTQRALVETEMQALFEKTVVLVSKTLHVEFSKVLELLPDGKALLLRAGVGWKLGQVGNTTVPADLNSQAGYTLLSSTPIFIDDLITHEPIIVEDLRTEKRFSGPPLLRDHDIVSGMSVIIYGVGRPFGVLGAHTTHRRTFTQNEAHFLQSVANILAAAIRRSRVEQTLRESEHTARRQVAELELLYEYASVGQCFLDKDIRFLRVNKWLADVDGHTPAEHIGHTLREMLPELANVFEPTVRKTMETGTIVKNLELDFVVDGESAQRRYHWLVNLDALKEDARIVGTNTVVADISTQKQLQEELQASECRLRELADAMPQIVWIARPDSGDMEYVNKKCFEFSGMTAKMIYSPGGWKMMVHPDDVDETDAAMRATLTTGKPFQKEIRLKQWDNEYRWHLSRALPARDDSGRILRWFGTCTDIEDEKRVEHDLQLTKEQLDSHARELESKVAERTAKLEETITSLREVLYHVAHDLRAPLRAIAGFTHLFQEAAGPQLNEEARDCVKLVMAASTRMDQLIFGLLTYGRLSHENVTLSRVDLAKQIRGLLEAMADEIKSTKTNVQVAEPLPIVLANPGILNQVLLQILRNALTFVAPEVTPRVRIWTESHGPSERLWIEDNGIGIASAHRERIFRIFERLHGANSYSGTGIGLAIVSKGMERMGGSAGVESTPGEGSRFWLELQADRPDAISTNNGARHNGRAK